ncbi:MAG: DNA repair protein RecO [Ilumatobacteraceae bacterium]
MSVYRDSAVVLRNYKLGESDRIIVMMTEEHGKVRAVAKGVRKTKSRFGSRLEPLSHIDVQLYKGRNLDIVTQVDLITSSFLLHNNLDRLIQGISMLEAVDQIAVDREPAPYLYRMLVGALDTLSRHASPIVLAAFYWKLLAAEGVSPEVNMCVGCQSVTELVAFDLLEGGAQCARCRSGVSITPQALELMGQILGGRLNEALAQVETLATAEVTHLATLAMEHHIERRLRSVSMFEQRNR